MTAATGNDLAERTDRVEGSADALSGVFQLPAMRAIASAIAEECQEFEGAFFDLLEARTILNATGATLDLIGGALAETRKGRSDSAYRVALKLLVRARLSNGKVLDILALLDILGFDYSYREYYPAGFRVEVFETADGPEIARWVFKARAAGVGAEVAYSASARASVFAVDPLGGLAIAGNVYSSVTNRTLGFGLASCRRV
jgi:hypothetical protein